MRTVNSISYHVVIPARFASERLPGKPWLDLAGQPVLQRVWLRASESAARSVIIATDDRRIADAAEAFGAQVVMTAEAHQSGSDRIAECAAKMSWPDDQLVVNLQGDEPFMPPVCLDQVAALLTQSADCEVASLFWPITEAAEVRNPNVVKVVTDAQNRAMYFSRAPVPFARAYESLDVAIAAGVEWKRHLGLYAYRLAALRHFTACAPTPLEKSERLEQLRIMEQGGRIVMARASEFIPAGIDTIEDLERARRLIRNTTL
ncbi:MAG: 3-deoxy-manno-octulosonate cytidylyltransferase [Lysobacterales bacterium]